MSIKISSAFDRGDSFLRTDVLDLQHLKKEVPTLKDMKDKGIRSHNLLTAVFYRIFGSGVVDLKDKNDKIYHLNRGSLEKWVKEHNDKLPVAMKSNTPNLSKLNNKELAEELNSVIHSFRTMAIRDAARKSPVAEQEQAPIDEDAISKHFTKHDDF